MGVDFLFACLARHHFYLLFYKDVLGPKPGISIHDVVMYTFVP
jgi:hypothetical protein